MFTPLNARSLFDVRKYALTNVLNSSVCMMTSLKLRCNFGSNDGGANSPMRIAPVKAMRDMAQN